MSRPILDLHPGDVDTTCAHCGLLMEGGESRFCCSGCRGAWDLIHGEGLASYYRDREADAPRPQSASFDVAVEPVVGRDGLHEVEFALRGLRCASCVWLAERVLERTEGVREAHVSYGSGQARVRWDPAVASFRTIADRVLALGYTPAPLGSTWTADRDLMTRLGVAAFCAANVMLLAIAQYVGWLQPVGPEFGHLFRWTALVLATPVALWSAAPFYRTAAHGVRHGVVHMDVPVSLAVAVMYAHGVWATLVGSEAYLDSMTMLVTLLLAGRVLETRGRQRAMSAAAALAASFPTLARRVRGTGVEPVSPDELVRGDRIVVATGEEIGADGFITSGRGRVAMALVTGESEPVEVGPGDDVVAGTVLMDGSVTVCVERSGDDTTVQVMARSLDDALTGSLDEGVDPWAAPFTVGTIALAVLSFLGWYAAAGAVIGGKVAIAVLVVACPCALTLARPLAAAAGLGAAARRGALIRSPSSLMALGGVGTVVLDKTGTATLGRPTVTLATQESLRISAALERHSIHPIARAILRAAASESISVPEATGVVEEPGVGIRGTVDGRSWALSAGEGGTLRLASDDDQVHTLRLSDRIRPEAPRSVASLKALGLDVVLLSGDEATATKAVGAELGVDVFRATLSPLDKVRWVEEAEVEGRTVLFVGDGVNDAPALRTASVGLAMHEGAGVAILAGDGVIREDGLGGAVAAVLAGRHAQTAVRRARGRAVAYNVVAVAAAAAGFVNPLVAAVLMPLSSSMVAWEANRIEARMAALESVS